MISGTALVVSAALFWGISGGIGALLIGSGWDPFVVSFYRGMIGLLFVLLWLALRPGHSGLGSWRLWFWSAVAGAGVAGNFAFYFLSIEQSGVAVAATLMYCAPVFVYLISFALGLERSTPFKWGAIILVMIGIVLLTRIYNLEGSGISAFGAGAGLLAGLSYALFIFGFKYAAPHGTPQAILSIVFTLLAGLLLWPAEKEQILVALATSDWPLFIALGVLGAGVSFVLYVIGLRRTAPAVAAVVAMVEPVTASLFGVALLEEHLVWSQVAGMGLILLTVSALSASSRGKKLVFKKVTSSP